MISVIVPVYNGERYLREALDSIFQQTYRPIEVIVVDDGSTDQTAAIAESYPVSHIVHQSNQGLPSARNRGIAEATGEWIAFLDADDFWSADKLSIQFRHLQKNPSLAVIFCRFQYVIAEDRARPLHHGPFCGVLLGGALIRTQVFEQVGLLNLACSLGDDLEWFFRVREAGLNIGFSQEVALFYRQHSGNMTYRKSLAEMNPLNIYRDSLARRGPPLSPLQFIGSS